MIDLSGKKVCIDALEEFLPESSASKLSLANCRLDNKSLEKLARILRENPQIIWIDLSNNSYNHDGLKCIAEMLISDSSIKTVYLNYLQGDLTIKQVARISRCVEKLVLRGNHFSPVHSIVLTDAAAKSTYLRMLDLSENILGDKGAEYLSKLLKTNETITELSLANNAIGNLGVKFLSHVLRHYNRTLTSLDLSNNRIKSKGLSKIKIMLDHNPVIKKINLKGNSLLKAEEKKAFFKEFQERDLKIFL